MSSKGFTKIEVLIVAIIALIIITVDIFVILYLNKKNQDIQTLLEVSQIRSGLEVYLMANNYYPVAEAPVVLNDDYQGTEKLCIEGFKKISDQCQKNILNSIPNFYIKQGNSYTYKSIDNNKNFQVEFNLLNNFKELGLLKGKNCATNTQINSQPCF
ncbi:MAG: hypothetical protein NT116_02445 [Candidatus Parcubacteria bacterium]|nr:hypothetical protein [Candidatus Parcubacteria bacterium]